MGTRDAGCIRLALRIMGLLRFISLPGGIRAWERINLCIIIINASTIWCVFKVRLTAACKTRNTGN